MHIHAVRTLQAPGEDLDDARKFGETQHPLGRDIPNVHLHAAGRAGMKAGQRCGGEARESSAPNLAEERHHVVLAHAVELNVLPKTCSSA
jgi:hypothetical protein